MGGSITIWLVWALLLFWSVGAYNRLVKLRAQAKASFAQLHEHLLLYAALVRSSFGAANNEGPAAQVGLVGAAEQYASSLQVAQGQCLDVAAVRALATAQEILFASWTRLRDEPPDLAGELVPEALEQEWQKIDQLVEPSRLAFNQCVSRYNLAIAEFPAHWLASLFRFKPAQNF
jgi:LemA protein